MRSKKFMPLLVAGLFMLVTHASRAQVSIQKSNLKVLYVGGSPNFSNETYKKPEEREADVSRRMASFEQLLNTYFVSVTTVSAKDYQTVLSDSYDVTVMDGIPGSKTYAADFDPKKMKYPLFEQLSGLPRDLTRPVLFIGEAGEQLGRSIGLKFDWYCLCLGAEAHTMRMGHAIFKGPFAVNMTTQQKPVPDGARALDVGKKPLPATISMWTVQTNTYENSKGFRPGLVARPGGFEDSPDAEYISGGTSSKDINAVALARHGSFFHWGFSASPEFMTPEAQVVLANAIVYIHGFNGKRVIARKYADRIVTSYDMEERRDLASERGRVSMNKYYKSLEVPAEKMLADLRAKKAKGDTLTQSEEAILKNYKLPEQMDLPAYLRSYQRDLYAQFGTNLKAYQDYYNSNLGYFYSDKSGEVTIDEDVKSLKIRHNDPKLLAAAISLWETGKDVEKAKRILTRYSLATFTTPEEWRKWYEQNKSQLFFSESGGYYFLINSNEKAIDGNDYQKKEKQTAYNAIVPGETDDRNAVSVAVGNIPHVDGTCEVVVKFRIHPGYHIYGYVSDKDPYIRTEVSFQLPAGYKAVSPLQVPTSTWYNTSGTTVFANEAIFTQEISGKGVGEVICAVTYQCCNDDICFPPVDAQYKIKI